MSEATDDEIASIFWRDTTKGTSDPFCWSGDTMFCYQVLAGVFVKGYRAALAEAAQAPKAIAPHASLEAIAETVGDMETDARGRKTYSFDSWGLAAFAREAVSIPSAEIDTSEKRVDQARAQAFEEAAAICDAIKDQKNEFGARTKNHYGPTIASGAMLAATAIRALAAKDAK